ncbi:MAG: MarR family transcriptional regulator [Candidatus Sericytochromatia bacterium]|nr:MarR family transcriptional regulator [Candidatus Sericytochromatia bacterium]
METHDNLDERLIESSDEMFLLMMRFTKKQLMEGSVNDTSITPPQLSVLFYLDKCGSMSMKDLSDMMGLTHGAATGLVDRVLKQGLISRVRLESDRRVVEVSITDQGRDLLQRIAQRRHAILRNIMQELSLEDRLFILKIHHFMKEKLRKYVE